MVSGRPRFEALLVAPDSPFDNDSIANAEQDFDDEDRPVVAVRFTPSAAQKLKDLTAANVGHRMALIFDGV